MNCKLVFHILGLVLRVEAVLMLPSAAIGFFCGTGDGADILLSAAITLLVGQLLTLLPRKGAKMQARDGFAAVGLAWIGLSLFGALPYVFSGVIPNYAEAVFETASGLTTTGATVLTFVEGQPRGILFWRGQTQWMGGVGVLVLALALFPKLGEGSVYLMRAESPGPIKSKLTPHLRDTAKILYTIYIGLTAAEVLCLCLAGMPLYDAVIHAFTTISTGGFSVRDASIGAYNSMAINWIVIIFMFLSGVNFSLLFAALRRDFQSVWRSEELRCYTVTTLVATGLIIVDLVVRAGRLLNMDTVTDAAFQMVTLMTTTGYMTDDYVLWPTFSQTVLIIVMLMGGCAGSTAGGIKHVRVVLLGKSLVRELRRILHPRQVTTIKCDGERVSEQILSGIGVFFFAYILLLMAGTLVTAWDGVDFITAFGASLTCLSNVGPGFGAMGPTSNFSALSDVSTVVLTLNMLLGRLEIMPLLLLAFPGLWKKR